MSAITDDEIEELERPRNLQKLHDFDVVESLLMRVRADAAKIARLEKVADEARDFVAQYPWKGVPEIRELTAYLAALDGAKEGT